MPMSGNEHLFFERQQSLALGTGNGGPGGAVAALEHHDRPRSGRDDFHQRCPRNSDLKKEHSIPARGILSDQLPSDT